MEYFNPKELKKLYKPDNDSSGEDNGQVTIIGGSSLFHGAPILSLTAASRIVDMVFFSSPENSLEKISDYIKSELSSFIWVPFAEIESYIEKSDAVLIGPGFMRYKSENSPTHLKETECDDACLLTRDTTKRLLSKFPQKKWVIDGGSLQTIEPEWIPKNSIITPNKKEFSMLFSLDYQEVKKMEFEKLVEVVSDFAHKYEIIIVVKGPETIVASSEKAVIVRGGNPGLTKGGTGDTQAGVTVALLSKNQPFLAACVGSFIVKKSAEEIFKRVGTYFNSDDLALEIPRTLGAYTIL